MRFTMVVAGVVAGLGLVAMTTVAVPAMADALGRIRDEGVVTLGYRDDGAPFSYANEAGEPAGYTVDLCREVVEELRTRLALPNLEIEFEPVDVDDRFAMLADGRIDLLCSDVAQSLDRREQVDFSLPIFVDGASVLFRSDGPSDFAALAGTSVGVPTGTTTEQALRGTLDQQGIDAEIVTVDTYEQGISLLTDGTITAYFADRTILQKLIVDLPQASGLRLSTRFFSTDTYAIAMARDEDDLRLITDRALSRVYRSDIDEIFKRNFGADARPTDVVRALFVISALP